jgi:hypothetical protein
MILMGKTVYKEWVHDGHTKIVSVTSAVGEFTEKIGRTADQATTRHYTEKSHASYLQMLKETILPNTEAVILLDFVESYSFLCHDAIQGFHWETDQATLHPFVVLLLISPLFHKFNFTPLGF